MLERQRFRSCKLTRSRDEIYHTFALASMVRDPGTGDDGWSLDGDGGLFVCGTGVTDISLGICQGCSLV